jgi:hypothetical protein
MPCKQARRDVSVDELKAVSIDKERLVRAVADNRNPDMDVRETPYKLRRRRRRTD